MNDEQHLAHGSAKATCFDGFETFDIVLPTGYFYGGRNSEAPVCDAHHKLDANRIQSEYTLYSPSKELLLSIIAAAEKAIAGIVKRELAEEEKEKEKEVTD